jgi:hypothetical protein
VFHQVLSDMRDLTGRARLQECDHVVMLNSVGSRIK